MNRLRTCACLLATVALAGCATASHTAQASTVGYTGHVSTAGHLTGRFVMEGGPIGPDGQQPAERPLPGTVTITAAGHRTVTIQVGDSGRFSVWLAPGRYHVSGRSPRIEGETTASSPGVELPCSLPQSVTITARHTAAITLACVVP